MQNETVVRFNHQMNELSQVRCVYRVSQKKAERSIFITLIFKNIAYFDFIR